MMGQQPRTDSLFYYFRLEDQIPSDHLLKRLDRFIDLGFVRERLRDTYSAVGRPSIDPEVEHDRSVHPFQFHPFLKVLKRILRFLGVVGDVHHVRINNIASQILPECITKLIVIFDKHCFDTFQLSFAP